MNENDQNVSVGFDALQFIRIVLLLLFILLLFFGSSNLKELTNAPQLP